MSNNSGTPIREPMLLAHPATLPEAMAAMWFPGGASLAGVDIQATTVGEAEHDRFFGIQRVARDPASLWRTALARSLREFTGRLAAQIPPQQEPDLLAGLSVALPPEVFRSLSQVPAAQDDTAWAPLDWWVEGHRLFLVLTQAATVALRDARRHMRLGIPGAATAGLDAAAALFLSSAAALRITASFSAGEYREQVRPLMAPPYVSAGFSGLLSVDHRMLVTALRQCRHGMDSPAVRPGIERLHAALTTVYMAHEGVCERFVGDTAPSLRTAASPRRSSAVIVLHELGERRTGLIDPGARSSLGGDPADVIPGAGDVLVPGGRTTDRQAKRERAANHGVGQVDPAGCIERLEQPLIGFIGSSKPEADQ
ncbi:hypothetical protein ABIA39_001399 [Nocardia sp. GAS34]